MAESSQIEENMVWREQSLIRRTFPGLRPNILKREGIVEHDFISLSSNNSYNTSRIITLIIGIRELEEIGFEHETDKIYHYCIIIHNYNDQP